MGCVRKVCQEGKSIRGLPDFLLEILKSLDSLESSYVEIPIKVRLDVTHGQPRYNTRGF